MTQAAPDRTVAVVVTWNRRELLAQTLDALADQSSPVDHIVVVDNASDDGTAADLSARASADADRLTVLRTGENIGGAGGFALGIRAAMQRDPELVWLMDDDTVPTPTALQALLTARADYRRSSGRRPAVLASRVVWTDGRDHPMNTPREHPFADGRTKAAAREVGGLAIRSASFVSLLADAEAIARHGLPVADYFLWNDDFEYSTRLIRGGVGLYVPESVVVHKTKTFGSTDVDPGPRFYYEVRNKLWLFGRSRSLSPREKLVYAAATARRWARTIAASPRRATVLKALGSGVKDGILTAPRPTEAVLDAALPPQAR